GARVDANLEAILLHGENVGAGLVQLVDLTLLFDPNAVTGGHDLGGEIEVIDVARVRITADARINDHDIRLWIIVLERRRDVYPRRGSAVSAGAWCLRACRSRS